MLHTTLKIVTAVFFVLCLFTEANTQDLKAFQIFDAQGKKIKFDKMAKDLGKAEVIYFGELHNDPIAHWLQYELTAYLGINHALVLGAEMFEADNQPGLTQYVKGQIEKDSFQKVVRLWKNYATDYSKLVEYAKTKGIEFIATNIPRKYARMVFQGGFQTLDTLKALEKEWIAPLPVEYDPEVPCYRNMMNMDMGGHEPDENFPKAQAIKDATMAYFIGKNIKPGTIFIHFNGSYHSDNHEGIVWYTSRQLPHLKHKTITTVLQKDVNKLQKSNRGLADYIICVHENMTNTY